MSRTRPRPTIDSASITTPPRRPRQGTRRQSCASTPTVGIQHIDRRRLLASTPPGSTLRLDTEPGRYAIRTTPICTIWPAISDDQLEVISTKANRLVHLGATRTMTEDPGYGVRQLVDVALRALSPGVNDPTTAQDAIFHLGTVLIAHFGSPPTPTAFVDHEHRRLLAAHALTDDDLAVLALAELRATTADQPTVAVYLLQMIGLVVEAAGATGTGDRTHALVRQASHIVDTVRRGNTLDIDRQLVQRTYETLFASSA